MERKDKLENRSQQSISMYQMQCKRTVACHRCGAQETGDGRNQLELRSPKQSDGFTRQRSTNNQVIPERLAQISGQRLQRKIPSFTPPYCHAQSERRSRNAVQSRHCAANNKKTDFVQCCLQATLRGSNAFLFYCFVACFLFQNVYGWPPIHSSDNDAKLTLSSAIINGEQTTLERNVRSVLTPPVHQEKTTPTKREISSVISNRHRAPQRLVTKLGYYVEIRRNGKVKGTRKLNANSVFEFTSIRTGVVAIQAKRTKRYLAMDKKGKVKSTTEYKSALCDFHESLVENNFFVFYKRFSDPVTKFRSIDKILYLGFDGRGKPKKGKKVHRNNSEAHFQKLLAVYQEKKRKRTKGRKNKKSRSRKSRKG